MLREALKTKATHTFRGRDSVELSLRIAAPSDARYRCTVNTPTGAAYSTVEGPFGTIARAGRERGAAHGGRVLLELVDQALTELETEV